MPTLPLTGGCCCGALRYELSAPPMMVYNCHCTNCQKIGGGAFSTSATILEAAFAFTKGEPRRCEWRAESGNRRYGLLCGDCGSRIVNGQVESPGILSLRAGTFDDTSWIEPVGDIWARSAQAWALPPSDRIRTPEQPGDYGPYIAKFQAQGRF